MTLKIERIIASVAKESQHDGGPDWVKIQTWLQSAALEVDYLVWRVIAAQHGGISEDAPRVYAMNYDMEDEPLTERYLQDRLKELGCRSA
ncbi:MAG: hypothetical protein IKO72_04275 [Kiritimatiellae bacterium]|nr:hypothetical protein [Kiritimatiellia bacterium]